MYKKAGGFFGFDATRDARGELSPSEKKLNISNWSFHYFYTFMLLPILIWFVF